MRPARPTAGYPEETLESQGIELEREREREGEGEGESEREWEGGRERGRERGREGESEGVGGREGERERVRGREREREEREGERERKREGGRGRERSDPIHMLCRLTFHIVSIEGKHLQEEGRVPSIHLTNELVDPAWCGNQHEPAVFGSRVTWEGFKLHASDRLRVLSQV